MKRGGRLVVGIGLLLLAVVVGLRVRYVALNLTEGQIAVTHWPELLLAVALALLGIVLLASARP